MSPLPIPTSLALKPAADFLKTHWRGATVVAALLLAFVSGRYSVPTKVTETSDKKSVTVAAKEKQTVTQDTEIKRNGTSTKTDKHYVETIDRKPSGEVIITKKLDTDTAKNTDNLQVKQDTKAETEVQIVYKDREVLTTKTVTRDSPNLFVTVGIGVPVQFKGPILGTPVITGSIAHKILGPLSAGISVSLDIKGQEPTVGGFLLGSF